MRASDETVVIGGGIIGLAVARQVLLARPGSRVTVFEKEPRLGAHQTARNSGVVHAGIYYPPGSLKARLCADGRTRLKEYAGEHGLPYDERGKLVVAVRPEELGRLERLERSAAENQVPGLATLDHAGIRDVEPHAAGIRALHSPSTAITDFVRVAEALGGDIIGLGGRVVLDAEVTGLRRTQGRVQVRVGDAVHTAGLVIACGGLRADAFTVHGRRPDVRIVPFRGNYLRVSDAKKEMVRGLIYPVPDPRYPFLGIHFTRRANGDLEVGPNAVLALARERYGRGALDLHDLGRILGWPGAWRLAASHWRTGFEEVLNSTSLRSYMRGARAYVPEIGAGDVHRHRAGIRAQAVDRRGNLVDDFRIEVEDGIVVVTNAPSPAATSCLAIADHIVGRLAG